MRNSSNFFNVITTCLIATLTRYNFSQTEDTVRAIFYGQPVHLYCCHDMRDGGREHAAEVKGHKLRNEGTSQLLKVHFCSQIDFFYS